MPPTTVLDGTPPARHRSGIARRDLLRAASATTLGALGGPAFAQEAFPSKPIRIIVGFTPGSIGDLFLRVVAQQLTASLGQSIVIDNKPGASQIISAGLAANAAPDGYTLYLGTQGGLVLNPVVRKKLPYDPIASFTPITMLFVTPMYLYTSNNLAARNVPELIELAKRQPGKLTFASIIYPKGRQWVAPCWRSFKIALKRSPVQKVFITRHVREALQRWATELEDPDHPGVPMACREWVPLYGSPGVGVI